MKREDGADTRVIVNGRFISQRLTGVQRYALEVTRRLGQHVQVVAPQQLPVEYKALKQLATVDRLGGVCRTSTLGHLWEQLVLPRWVKGDALLWCPAGVGPLAVREQVLTIHDLGHLEHPEWYSLRFVRWYRFLLPRLVSRVSRVIAVSQFTKERLVEVVNAEPEKIAVIPNGVDAAFRPLPLSEIARTREALGIPTSSYVLTLSSIEPRKNLQNLLRAWKSIEPDLPAEICLVVAGSVGRRSIFRDAGIAGAQPRVYFTGYVDDRQLPGLYSGALLFAYVPLYEGFGLPPLESMACGTPVLVSNAASLPEVVGGAAVTVDPSDAEAIGEGIQKLVSDSNVREELCARGLVQAQEHTWERTASLTEDVLLEAAEL